jgi:hypothetical protein
MEIQAARKWYFENGYDPIPLREKIPVSKGWQQKPTFIQWRHAKPDANIGLRSGYQKAFIDLDDKNRPGTSETFFRWLYGKGYQTGSYPVVETPSGGHHVYVKFTGKMIDSKRNLLPGIGAGEFRYGPGAYVAAFPSVLTGGGAYRLIRGDIAQLPELDLQDVSTLINVNEIITKKPEPKMSRLATLIANGKKPDRYTTDSEAEAALVLSLINSGNSYEYIKHVFNCFPCLGHFRNKHAAKGIQEAERWLYMTYQNALAFSQGESPVRRMIAQFIEQAVSASWSNANRKKVFIAHLEIAHRAGRLEYSASSRDLALMAKVYRDTAMSQTARLIDANFLAVKTAGSVTSATIYKLGDGKLPPLPKNTKCEEVVEHSRPAERLSSHDAFRNGGGKYAKGRLGRRAGEVYELIFNNPLTVTEIAKQTGADVKTVKAALQKMHKFIDYRTGEIIEMVSHEGRVWYSNLVDLDLIAGFIGTLGATGKQRMNYEKERRDHIRMLELGMLKKVNT